MEQSSADITNLYRPNQVEEARKDLDEIVAMMNAPPHIRAKVSDTRGMRLRADRIKAGLEKFEPKAYPSAEKDAAVAEFLALSSSIKQGMCSSEEMRRNPPGAVEKHRAWEAKKKKSIARWKHVGLRLEAGGDVPAELHIPGATVNIETLRIRETHRDLSMDGAQIPKVANIHIGADPANTVIFSDAEEAMLKSLSPILAAQLATMGNAERAGVKEIVVKAMGVPVSAPPSATVGQAKPEAHTLNFSQLVQLAKKNGLNTKHKKTADLVSWLRAKHLIQ